MKQDKPVKQSLSKTETNRAWKERNADKSKHLGLVIPRSAFEEWRVAGVKSGLSMSGLMLACIDFLNETDGARLQEMARHHGRRHGLRVQIEDATTGKVTRVRAGRYRRSDQ